MTNGERPGIVHVLLVEDNEGDVLLFRQALKDTDDDLQLHVVQDGKSALEFVNRNDPRPSLVVMDLNLPGKTGAEVLRELKARADSREIPVKWSSAVPPPRKVISTTRISSQAAGSHIQETPGSSRVFWSHQGLYSIIGRIRFCCLRRNC